MRVESPTEPSRFLAAARELLLADEARHNLVLGLASTLRDHPTVYPEWRLWLVRSDDAPVAAALQTPPFNLVLAEPRSANALEALVDAIAAEGLALPGVTGAVPEADALAALWEERRPVRRRLRRRQRIHRAAAVHEPEGVTGTLRTATAGDRALLASWLDAFAREAGAGADAPAAQAERWLDSRLAGAGGFAIWEDDGPVSLAGWGGRTPNGVRIGPVFTPPEHRRRGYGSAVTAAVSRRQLATGRRFCFLYTDLANATANRIYARLGYEPVCDSVDYAFERG